MFARCSVILHCHVAINAVGHAVSAIQIMYTRVVAANVQALSYVGTNVTRTVLVSVLPVSIPVEQYVSTKNAFWYVVHPVNPVQSHVDGAVHIMYAQCCAANLATDKGVIGLVDEN